MNNATTLAKLHTAISRDAKSSGRLETNLQLIVDAVGGDMALVQTEWQIDITAQYDENVKAGEVAYRPFAVVKAAISRLSKKNGWKASIKKGVLTLTIADAEPVATGEGEGESAGEGGDNAATDKLWAAVDLVLANLHQPAIMSALRSGFEQMAKANGARVG